MKLPMPVIAATREKAKEYATGNGQRYACGKNERAEAVRSHESSNYY
ncbi:hypothetical protein GCM10027398_32840 [Azotobacter salinestris]